MKKLLILYIIGLYAVSWYTYAGKIGVINSTSETVNIGCAPSENSLSFRTENISTYYNKLLTNFSTASISPNKKAEISNMFGSTVVVFNIPMDSEIIHRPKCTKCCCMSLFCFFDCSACSCCCKKDINTSQLVTVKACIIEYPNENSKSNDNSKDLIEVAEIVADDKCSCLQVQQKSKISIRCLEKNININLKEVGTPIEQKLSNYLEPMDVLTTNNNHTTTKPTNDIVFNNTSSKHIPQMSLPKLEPYNSSSGNSWKKKSGLFKPSPELNKTNDN
ncbi:MAG: hypothetical protein HRT87_07695 [Legionellales bacterium]|nr:hypothetical protein [Legionellales bacterium]